MSFSVLFGTSPISFGIFPICPWIVRGFSRFVLFLFLSLSTAPTRNSPERVRGTIWTFPPEKSGKPPGLPSLKLKKLYTPPPPSRHFWPYGIFQGRGVGVYILRPHAAGILYAPPFYTPPTPKRVFSGVGGGGCIKFGPGLPSLKLRSRSSETPRLLRPRPSLESRRNRNPTRASCRTATASSRTALQGTKNNNFIGPKGHYRGRFGYFLFFFVGEGEGGVRGARRGGGSVFY